jgi:hypothetical protein
MTVIEDFFAKGLDLLGVKSKDLFNTRNTGYVPGIAGGMAIAPKGLTEQQRQEVVSRPQDTEPLSKKLGRGAATLFEKAMELPVVSDLLYSAYFTYEQIWRRGLTTGFIYAQRPDVNLFEAYDASEDVGLTQSLVSMASIYPGFNLARNAYLGGEGEPGYADRLANVKKFTPWLAPDFDLLDDQKRVEAYEENWSGSLLTGGLSLAQMYLEGAGTAYLVRKGAAKAGFTQRALDDMDKLKAQAAQAKEWFDGGQKGNAPNGMAVDIAEAITETSPARLQETVKFFKEMPEEMRGKSATLAAKIDNFDDMNDFFFASMGDRAAFESLFKRRASVADALDDFGIYNNKQLLTQSEIWGMPDPLTSARIFDVVMDLRKTDPIMAQITSSWASDIGKGIGLTNWAPSRYATLEQARIAFAKMKQARKYGAPLSQVPRGGSTVYGQTIQSDLWSRPIHLVQNVYGEKPRWMIDYSDPRGLTDATTEMIAQMNTVKYMRGPEYAPLKEDFINKYSAAITLKQKQEVVEGFEKTNIIEIAKRYGVSEEDAVSIYTLLKAKQKYGQEEVAKTGTLPEGEVGAYVFDDLLRSQIATHHIMFDFGLFDRELKRFAIKQGLIEKGTLSLKGLRGDYYARDLFDTMNSVFSIAVLVRPGYIPKNSIVEPQMRILGVSDSHNQIAELLPSTKRYLDNTVWRNKYYGNVIYNALTKRSSKGYQSKTKALQSDIKNTKTKISETDTQINQIQSQIRNLEKEQYYKYTSKQLDKDVTIDKEIFDLQQQLDEVLTTKEIQENAMRFAEEALQETQSAWAKQAELRGILRGKIKSQADEPVTFTTEKGVKITVPGGLAPGAKGGLVMRTEVDPVSSKWAASIHSAQAARLKALTRAGEKTEIRPGDENYFTAFAEELNIRAKNDELIKMWAAGVSMDDAIAWLGGSKNIDIGTEIIGRDAGRNYWNSVLEYRAADATGYLPEYVTEIYNRWNQLVPDADIRENAIARLIRPEELESRYASRNDLLPVVGKKATVPGRFQDKLALSLNNATSWAFGVVAGVPERIISKNPFYTRRWKESVERQIKQAEGMGVEVTGDLINDRFRFIANSEALKAVEETFYVVRRLNNYQYLLRFGLGFPTAYINSYKFWTKQMVKNPYNAVIMYKFQGLPYEFGMVVDQDGNKVERRQPREEGEERFLILGQPGYLKKTMDPYTKKVNTDQWNFMLGNVQAGWLGQVALSEFIVRKPDLEKTMQEVMGKDIYNLLLYSGRPVRGGSSLGRLSNIYKPGYLNLGIDVTQQFVKEAARRNIDVPFVSYMAGLTGAMDAKDQESFVDEFVRIRDVAWINWAAEGSIEGEEPDNDELKKVALKSQLAKAGWKWLSPLGVTFEPVNQFFRDVFTKIEENYATGILPVPEGQTPYRAAEDALMDLYGEEIIRFFGSKYTKQTTFRPDQESYATYKNNRELVEKVATINPMLVGMVTNPDVPGEFSPAIAAWMERTSIGGKDLVAKVKSAEERQAQFEERVGWNRFVKLKNQKDYLLAKAGLKSLNGNAAEPIRDWYKEEVRKIEGDYPGWGRAYGRINNGGIVERETLPALVLALQDRKFMDSKKDSTKWQAVSVWMIDREEYFQEYQANKGNKPMQDAIKLAWSEREQTIINQDTYFADFHARYLDADQFTMGIEDFIRLGRVN